jgi:hypothetical protein
MNKSCKTLYVANDTECVCSVVKTNYSDSRFNLKPTMKFDIEVNLLPEHRYPGANSKVQTPVRTSDNEN